MTRILLTFLFALCFTACSGPRYSDYFPYHDDGVPKPKIVLMPILDRANPSLPWSISEELTDSLYYSLMNSGELYVLSPEEIGSAYTQCSADDFFGNHLNSCKKFCNADFIVAIEIIEHRVVDDPSCSPCNRMLNLKARVKAIDVRCSQPSVVLFEIIGANYKTTSPCDKIDYEQYPWGSNNYCKTPCYTAHTRLVQNITNRLEQTFKCCR